MFRPFVSKVEQKHEQVKRLLQFFFTFAPVFTAEVTLLKHQQGYTLIESGYSLRSREWHYKHISKPECT